MLNKLNIEVSTHVKHTKHRYLHSTLMHKCCTFRYLHMLNILNIEVSTYVKHAKHWYLRSTSMLNIFLNNNYFSMRGGVWTDMSVYLVTFFCIDHLSVRICIYKCRTYLGALSSPTHFVVVLSRLTAW